MNYAGYFVDEAGNKYYPETNDVVLLSQSYTFIKKNAGEAGYFTVDVNIPDGYRIGSISVETGQISNSNGLQITPIYGLPYTPGIRKFYFNYYSPETQLEDIPLTIYLLCFKKIKYSN